MKLEPAGIKWWSKPLAIFNGRPLPAELVVLRSTLRPDEEGAWLNSRGTKTGAVDLCESRTGEFATSRVALPDHVQACLRSLYEHPAIRKGVYDLVVWSQSSQPIRFVEVKCPHWDRPTPEQRRFEQIARERGIETEVVEWEFTSVRSAA